MTSRILNDAERITAGLNVIELGTPELTARFRVATYEKLQRRAGTTTNGMCLCRHILNACAHFVDAVEKDIPEPEMLGEQLMERFPLFVDAMTSDPTLRKRTIDFYEREGRSLMTSYIRVSRMILDHRAQLLAELQNSKARESAEEGKQ